jgi:hypothetical protein
MAKYFSPEYKRYLQSPQWKRLRRLAISSVDGFCQRCKQPKKDLEVHHKNYNNFGNEDLSDLEVLCKSCHELIHDNKDTAYENRADFERWAIERFGDDWKDVDPKYLHADYYMSEILGIFDDDDN